MCENKVEVKETNKKYEDCVSCGKETTDKKSTHVDLRQYYVDGAGQLCADCYDRVYSQSKR